MNINNTTLHTKYPHPITIAYLSEIFHDCSDFMVREVYIGEREDLPVWVCWIDGISSGTNISNDILRPLTSPARFEFCADLPSAYKEIYKGEI